MHLTPNISYPLMMVVSALMLPVMIVRFYMGVWEMVLLDFPLIVASFWSLSAFYVIAQRELHPKNWKRSILLLPMLMAVGVGLTLINTRAVLEALFGVKSGFVRTPKYAIEGTAAKAHGREEVQAPQRLAALFRTGLRHAISSTCAGLRSRPTTIPTLPFLRCSSADITGPVSARSIRNIRTASATTASTAWNSKRPARPWNNQSSPRNGPRSGGPHQPACAPHAGDDFAQRG